MDKSCYTFGDTEQASARLRLVAELYEPETRELLEHGHLGKPHLAVDLGCGPGWSTRLMKDVLDPDRTIGLDASKRFIESARRERGADLEFEVHDVTRAPFPVPAPDLMFCRFLLTHLSSVAETLNTWASIGAPGALLLVHETESLETEHPALARYYELVGQLQQHYGQALLVGPTVDACFKETGWRVIASDRRAFEKPASRMAKLHLVNLGTWRHDAYASRAFDAREIDQLEASLGRIAQGVEDGGMVVNAARQIIARRSGGSG